DLLVNRYGLAIEFFDRGRQPNKRSDLYHGDCRRMISSALFLNFNVVNQARKNKEKSFQCTRVMLMAMPLLSKGIITAVSAVSRCRSDSDWARSLS
ncbi:MAG: hypothetical protein ACXWTG_00720, partial [Methylosarcina sp.]